MSLSREETLALAALMDAMWEVLSLKPPYPDQVRIKSALEARRDDLLRQAGLPTDEEMDDGG